MVPAPPVAASASSARSIQTWFCPTTPCRSACNGARLRLEVLAVTVAGHNIAQVAALPVSEAREWAWEIENEQLRMENNAAADNAQSSNAQRAPDSQLTSRESVIAKPILKE